MRVYGAFKSDFTGVSEYTFDGTIPDEYYHEPSTEVQDQGSNGSCVAQAQYEMVTTYNLFNNINNPIKPNFAYALRSDRSVDGMTPREAFDILVSHGYINSYARLGSIIAMKAAILAKGAILVSLPAYSSDTQFWKPTGPLLGGHAVAFTGYDSESFYLKNSWGYSYGDYGCTDISIEDVNKYTLEAWTIVS